MKTVADLAAVSKQLVEAGKGDYDFVFENRMPWNIYTVNDNKKILLINCQSLWLNCLVSKEERELKELRFKEVLALLNDFFGLNFKGDKPC